MAENSSKRNTRLLNRMVHRMVFSDDYAEVVPQYSRDWAAAGKLMEQLFLKYAGDINIFYNEEEWGVIIKHAVHDVGIQISESNKNPLQALCRAAIQYVAAYNAIKKIT